MTDLKPKFEELQSIRPTGCCRRAGRTLQLWAEAPAATSDRAVEIQSQEVYDRYDKYRNGCVMLFRDGYTSVHQYTLQK